MADLLSKDMLTDIIINIINIVVLFLVTRALLYKPVKKYLDKRKQTTEDAMNEALRLKEDALLSQSRYEELVSDADAAKRRAVESAKKDAEAEVQGILDDAKAQADGIIKKGRAEISEEHEKMLASAKDEIADIALQISGKVLGRTVTDADTRKIIDSFFAG